MIIINDGSTDSSKNIIEKYSDKRIVFIDQTNKGLAATLNRGLDQANGVYIARQDNDDISDPTRLEKQFNFLENHTNVVLLGTAAEIINENGASTNRFHDHPNDSKNLKFALLFKNPFVHSSVMFRKSAVEKVGPYDLNTKFFEDHNLWSKLARVGEIANLPERLLKYREVQVGMSKTTLDYSERVFNQALINIRHNSPRMEEKEIEHFLKLYLNAGPDNDLHTSLLTVQTTLDRIARDFAEREGISETFLAGEKKKLLIDFKRAYYQKVLSSDKSGLFAKLKARILRKILFKKENLS